MHQRPLLPAEWSAAADLVAAAFRHGYEALLPPAALARMVPDYLLELWTAAPHAQLIGLIDEQRLVGVCRVGANPEAPEQGHLFSLYVDPARQGQGLGRQLLDAASAALRHAGFATATLWVFADNARAHALYVRAGWTPTGRARVEAEWGAQEVELQRTLDVV